MEQRIVVEDKINELILSRFSTIKVIAASGHSSALSTINSLANDDTPRHVFYVFDTDTYSETKALESINFTKSYCRVRLGSKLTLIPVVAELTCCLFVDRTMFENTLGFKLSHDEWLKGKFQSKNVISKLFNNQHDKLEFISKLLSDENVSILKNSPILKTILDKLK